MTDSALNEESPKTKHSCHSDCGLLREALKNGEWVDFLPGSRVLSERLQVSAYTLHQALMILKNERLVRVAHGRRTRILPQKLHRPTPQHSSRMVIALTTQSLEEMESPYHILRLQHYLQIAGFELMVHSDPWPVASRR